MTKKKEICGECDVKITKLNGSYFKDTGLCDDCYGIKE